MKKQNFSFLLTDKFNSTNTHVVLNIVRSEAHALVDALKRNTEAPTPVMSLLTAAELFLDCGNIGPAAVVYDALYTIAGLDQDKIATALLSRDGLEGFFTLFHREIVEALEKRLSECDDEDDADDDGLYGEVFTLRDIYTPNIPAGLGLSLAKGDPEDAECDYPRRCAAHSAFICPECAEKFRWD